MKIQFASDLHLEFISQSEKGYIGIEPAPDADVLVLAGDIHNGTSAVELFKDWPVPVIYVFGNHDAYRCIDLDDALEEMRRACEGTSILFLEKDAVVIEGVRFLGTTLWTDYLLFGNSERKTVMDYCRQSIYDHTMICVAGLGITPVQLLTRHEQSRMWLAEQMEVPFEGKTVVVTHHAPHPASLPNWHKSAFVKAAYASDLTELMDIPTLWLHGHVHLSVDYSVRNTRIATNPRGYPRHFHNADGSGGTRFQNEDFDRLKIIDLND